MASARTRTGTDSMQARSLRGTAGSQVTRPRQDSMGSATSNASQITALRRAQRERQRRADHRARQHAEHANEHAPWQANEQRLQIDNRKKLLPRRRGRRMRAMPVGTLQPFPAPAWLQQHH